MGGHRLKQRNRPIKLFYERSEKHYQELVKKTAGLTGVGITVLTREKQWTLIRKTDESKGEVTNIVRAITRRAAIVAKENNKVTRILGSLGFLGFKSLGTAESGGSRFPWTSVNNCTPGADSLENTCVPDIETSNQTITMNIESVIPVQGQQIDKPPLEGEAKYDLNQNIIREI